MLKTQGCWCPIWTAFWENQNGQDVVFEDGTEIKATDYISAPRPGKIITILGRYSKNRCQCASWLSMPMPLSMNRLMARVMKRLLVTMATLLT